LPRFLHIDYAGREGSVCLSADEVLIRGPIQGELDVSAFLAPAIEALLNEAGWAVSNLDAISVNLGPGSYTSLRSSLALAQGMAAALEIPLIGLSRPILMAAEAENQEGNIVVAFHARADHWSAFIFNQDLKQVSQQTTRLEDVLQAARDIPGHPFVIIEPEPFTELPKDYNNFKFYKNSSINHIKLANKYYLDKIFCDLANLRPIYFSDPRITTAKK